MAPGLPKPDSGWILSMAFDPHALPGMVFFPRSPTKKQKPRSTHATPPCLQVGENEGRKCKRAICTHALFSAYFCYTSFLALQVPAVSLMGPSTRDIEGGKGGWPGPQPWYYPYEMSLDACGEHRRPPGAAEVPSGPACAALEMCLYGFSKCCLKMGGQRWGQKRGPVFC